MSTELEITRIRNARNKIRTKMNGLGLATSTATIDELATAVDGIKNNGAVSAKVQEGDTYTIPKGYHNGSGTVSGIAGGGKYDLQSKTVIPTKSEQNITPDLGYYGLSDITVNAIPETYQDVTSVTATAADVLANKVIVDKAGKSIAGTMVNNGTVSKTLSVKETEFKIPIGYHSGSGSVKIVLEAKTATPTKALQNIVPTDGKVLSKVTVAAIPEEFVKTTDADAIASNILIDKTAYVNGTKITGTMPENGTISASFDGLSTTSYTIPAGHTSGGTVSLTKDIENALAEI